MQPTARLENWKLLMLDGHQLYKGEIYGDIKERFPDGMTVYTSDIVSHNIVGTVTYVRTTYSIYQLGKKFEDQSVSELNARYERLRRSKIQRILDLRKGNDNVR